MVSRGLRWRLRSQRMAPPSARLVAAAALAVLSSVARASFAPPPLDVPASVAAELADEERRRETSSRHACFRAAYEDVASDGCRSLTDEGKMRLAFLFARCQLEATGRDASAAPCAPSEAVADCGRRLTAEGYTEFGAWFRHVDTLCFALESRRWREDTTKIVASLVTAGDDTVRRGYGAGCCGVRNIGCRGTRREACCPGAARSPPPDVRRGTWPRYRRISPSTPRTADQGPGPRDRLVRRLAREERRGARGVAARERRVRDAAAADRLNAGAYRLRHARARRSSGRRWTTRGAPRSRLRQGPVA